MNEHNETQRSGFPSVRIWLCGAFQIEWIHPETGLVLPTADPTMGGRDRAAAIALLALLLCQPNRQAHRDWIMEQFWPESSQRVAVHRLENIFSCLRKLLRSPTGEESLLRSITGKKSSGTSYGLEAYPKLWVDLDALTGNIEQAARMERFGEDALPFWQRAFELFKRGPFLVDDPYDSYATWVKEQREHLDGYTRQCVHALARLYLANHTEAGKAEAQLVLRTYWQRHKTDEDALRPLLELLGEQERYQEAEQYYQQLLLTLSELEPDEEGQPRVPDARTHDIREYLRTKQIRRERIENSPSHQDMPSNSIGSSFSRILTPDALEIALEGDGIGPLDISRRILLLQHLLGFTGANTISPAIVASLPELERLSYDPLQLFRNDEITPEKLQDFAILTEICRHLSEGNELKTAEKILWSYLPRVESLVRYTLREPKTAASIASQGYLLVASLAGHRNGLHARQYYSEQALLYGEIAQDSTLQVAAFRQLATTFNYLQLPHKVMQTYQRALVHIDKVPPLLRSCIYAALSGVCAQFQQRQDADHFIGLAYESFGEHQGDEPDFLRAINASQNLLIHWDGKNHLQLGRPHLAEKVFMRLDVLDPSMQLPKRIRVEAINNRARMFIAVRNMEQACLYFEVAVKLAVEIGSSLRLQEVATTFQSLKSTWPYEQRVRKSSDLFIQHLINYGH